MFFGIDVGGTKIQFAAGTEEEVVILDKVSTPASYIEFLEVVEVNFLKAESDIGEKLNGVGIGIPGTFSKEKVIWVPNIPCIEGQDLVGDLKKRLGGDVFIGNDAQLALVGEVWRGAGRGHQDVILMSIGTGIGGAIMIGGKLIKGQRGAAGALGWINLDASEPGDKNHGYLENHASGKSIGKVGEKCNPPMSTYELVERAKQGDVSCMKAMDRVGHLIGSGLASIASVLDTEIIILSGGLSEELAVFKDSMNMSFSMFSAPGVEQVPIVKSKLGNLSGAYGAVRLAMVSGELWI